MILENTRILEISEKNFTKEDRESLAFAADVIRRGGTVCFPTETVYGLGANALDAKATESIFTAKGRTQDNPLIIHLDTPDKADLYCEATANPYFEKVRPFMPGPITAVLKKRSCIPDVVTAKLPSVGLRVPSHPTAHAFLEACGVPIAAPSANLSGRPSPTCARHVIEDLYGKVDVILASGESNVGLESTIVSLVTEPPTLLRPGGITYEQLCDALGEVAVSSAVLSEMKPGDTAVAPGMKYKHYAPRTPVYLVVGEDERVCEFLRRKQETEHCAVLCFSEDVPHLEPKLLADIGAKDDAALHAHRIFAALRDTDEIPELKSVYVHITDDKSGLNLAVFNRLLKASAYHILTV